MEEKRDNPYTVLIVEDNEDLSRLIQKQLRRAGFNTAIANNGKKALNRIDTDPPELMLLDYKLPDMTGRQIVNTLAERGIIIPYITMTGYGDEKLSVEMMKAGARDYVVKEGNFFELLPSVVEYTFEEVKREKKLVEVHRALEESERKYRTLVDNALVGVFMSNLSGDILFVNGTLSKMFKFDSPEEMMSRNSLTFYKKRQDRKDFINMLVKTGRVNNHEIEMFAKSGETLNIIVSAVLEGDIFSGMAIDITVHKKMEKRLSQSEKLHALGTMAAGIAHDFNNILAVIQGHAQLLENDRKDEDNLIRRLRIINKAACDGAETVYRMSLFTKKERDNTQFITVDLNNILKQAVNFSKPRWKDIAYVTGITYDFNMDIMTPLPAVKGNPSELREMLINIINNALDATPNGGQISFRTWEESEWVCLSISDNGCGMTEEVKNKIFDPFFTTKGIEGSGLGLSMVYGIISRHDGKINIESQIGEGSAFIIKLPITRKNIDEEKIDEEVHSEPKINIKDEACHILVVDDEKEIGELLKYSLSREGYLVESVMRGVDAIRMMKEKRYDIVLCDIGMPNVSGWDVARAVEALDEKPVLGLMTGWIDKLDYTNGKDANTDFIIKKPIDLTKLTRLIKTTMMKAPRA